jgi:hypothetical protein
MPFDDLPILDRILIGVLAPLLVAIFCWLAGPRLAGPRLAGPRRKRTRARSWVEFWLSLIAAYLIFAIAG